MTTTKEEATRILGFLTDTEIDDWKALLRRPNGFHQTHGSWMEAAGYDEEPGECCLTVLARRVGGLDITDDGLYDDGEEENAWEDSLASETTERLWGMNLDPFIGRNDNIQSLLGDDPAAFKYEDRETRPWTYAEIAEYLDELQEARNG